MKKNRSVKGTIILVTLLFLGMIIIQATKGSDKEDISLNSNNFADIKTCYYNNVNNSRQLKLEKKNVQRC